MCRLLCVRSREDFPIREHLAPFARIARDSREYQGHGWGCAWLEDGRWRLYHDIRPIWEDDWRPPGRTTLLLAHARSAFRDEGIRVENNMPFHDGERVFIFNGELRGVRIKERGRIGAEKVFNFVKRFDRGDFRVALERGLEVIRRRTRHLRAMNLVVADTSRRVHLATNFSEDPDYFQMHTTELGDTRVISSEPYPGHSGQGARLVPHPQRHRGYHLIPKSADKGGPYAGNQDRRRRRDQPRRNRARPVHRRGTEGDRARRQRAP